MMSRRTFYLKLIVTFVAIGLIGAAVVEGLVLYDNRYFVRNIDSYNWPDGQEEAYWGLNVTCVFCRNLDDGSFTRDNCIVIARVGQLAALNPGAQERTPGDVFNLSKRENAPFKLPLREITLAELRAATDR
jgi:hypothetical protein